MNKGILKRAFIISTLLFANVLLYAQYSINSITPPPVSRVDCHEGSGCWVNSLWLLPGFMEETLWMDSFIYSKCNNETSSWEIQAGTGKFLVITPFIFRFSRINEWVGGEKVDIAGEVIEKRTSISNFSSVYLFYMGGELFPGMRMNFSMVTWDVGIVAEIPISWAFFLQPYISSMVYQYYSLDIPDFGKIEGDSWLGGMALGMDIVLTPFRNDRSWKISLGTALPLFLAKMKGIPIFMISIKHEWGKYFTGTKVEIW